MLQVLVERHSPNAILKKRFNVTGIHPLNANIFDEDEFLSFYVTA
jgi:hypothetical protein